MTTFAEKAVIYSDGQINVMPLPEAIMANGFIPETRDAPGMPLAAQHLNWLFRDLYRRVNESWLPAWTPIPCPMAAVPEGYLKCNGAAFDKTKYPELAKGYPSGVLPDLRGEFIRGWDDGRGVDAGRGILSVQGDAIRNIRGYIGNIAWPPSQAGGLGSGVFSAGQDYGGWAVEVKGDSVLSSNTGCDGILFDAGHVVPTALENRPRNIAFLYIVRAA